MKAPKHSLRKIVRFLNNPDEEGGFWLPNIQRPFVWDEEQICRLFDSILREYPISTLLIWKTRSQILHRKFIENYRSGLKLSDFYVPRNEKKKCLVLDGQQRLQSLFIGLCGSYDGRELYLDILSGELAAPADIKYKFAFLDLSQASSPQHDEEKSLWIKFKELVNSPTDPLSAAEEVIAKAGRELSAEEKKKISRHVGIVFKTFHSDDGISYQELDSTENNDLYSEDDVVEVFIRANSGGTKLGKSDLLFSLLSSSWDQADKQMEELLEILNRRGFAFNRDFVLKICLALLDQGAQYGVSKFRKEGIREDIERNWDNIAKAIKDVHDFVEGKTFIRCDKALPSYLVLIPLVYTRYHFPDKWRVSKEVDNYLLRSLLTGSFSGNPDRLIDECINNIRNFKTFGVDQIFEIIRSQGRSLELTEEKFWQIGYGSATIHLLFNLWYRDFHYTPAYENNMPQVDHIFPQSALKKVKVVNPETTKRYKMKYKESERNQLANCMLLTQKENGARGKSDTLPENWFADKDDDYLNMHLIPKDKRLWKIERFEDFITERKNLIRQKFAFLFAPKTTA
jgi:hypothetical protein